DGGAMFDGDRGAELDGEVRDAERGIDAGGKDGSGGTGVDAAAAGAAAGGGGGGAAGGGWGVGCDVERDEQFAEKEPGAAPLVDEAGVFADPAERGEAGVGALQKRRGIPADSGFEWTGGAAEQGIELLKAAAELV